MDDRLDLFRNRMRALLTENSRRQIGQARQPFDPGELLMRLLGLARGTLPQKAFLLQRPLYKAEYALWARTRQREWERMKREHPELFPPEPVGKEIAPGITEYVGVQPPYMKRWPPTIPEIVRREEPPEPLVREVPEIKSVEERRKEIRKKYPFTGWQK